jgi:hypothetical protein
VLLDDEIAVVTLDDSLDVRDFVAREDTESVRVQPQASVLGETQAHNRHAAWIRALADQVMGQVPLIIELNDPLVDVPKQDLV